jgi:hypothetical protein
MRGLNNKEMLSTAFGAQAAGLAVDWKCLPDPSKLDPAAPAHFLPWAYLR